MLRVKSLLPFLIFLAAQVCIAQQPAKSTPGSTCSLPLLSNPEDVRNMFNDQQEEWLGDILDQGMRKEFHLIDDPDGYLQKIGERLLAALPPTQVHYRFVIVDSPGLNSFGLAGGRIYIYRSMIAFTKNEDELAALVGHEIGHMIMHQEAIRVSDNFRRIGIKEVTDKEDIFKNWNRFEDSYRRLKGLKIDQMEKREQKEQLIADSIALYALKRAGYDPAQFAAFADRSLETKGKTGGFWSDFFGTTTPESRRLRQILKDSAPLPAGCIAPHPNTSAFEAWQRSIIQAKFESAKAEIPGLIRQVRLNPPLRNELNYLTFSPDGRYLLAQDSSGIFVLSREPFKSLFRIDALDAKRAQFTPDSNAIVFYDKELRVEEWNIATQRQAWIHEISANCDYSALSPTGEVLACVSPTFELKFIAVKSGEILYTRKNFFELTFSDLLAAIFILESSETEEPESPLWVNLAFSPDGRYFLGGHGDYSFAYDFVNRSEVKVPGKLKRLVRASFIFTSATEVFGVDGERSQKAFRIAFPSGQVLDEFPFGGDVHFLRAINANYVMVTPAGVARIGAVDLSKKKTTMGYKTAGFAIFGDWFAGDDVDGLLKLYRLSDRSEIAKIQLPGSPLAGAKASTFSDDGKWLALSGPTRGGLWSLESGHEAGFSTDFDGGFFTQGTFVGRFPGRLKDPARVLQVNLNPLSMHKLYDLELTDELPNRDASSGPKTTSWQMEDLLFQMGPSTDKKSGDYRLDIKDVVSNASLWHLDFSRFRPRLYYLRSSNTITSVVSRDEEIKRAVAQDPELQQKFKGFSRSDKRSLYLVEVYEARSHRSMGRILVDSGNLSFRVKGAVAAGDSVFVVDSKKRTLVYSLKSGEKRGEVFGNAVAVSSAGDKVLIENGRGVVDLYDTKDMRSLKHFTFPSRIVEASFLNGDKVMVLTADETVYELGLANQDVGSVAKQPATP